MLKTLSDRPEVEELETFLRRLLAERKPSLEFVVLFGSMARGNWSHGSDYDLIVGLRDEDDKRLIDRMQEFASLAGGNLEIFPYSRSQGQRMFEEFHPLLLEALEHGIVLWDRGGFAGMKESFQHWRDDGVVVPWRSGWKIEETAANT